MIHTLVIFNVLVISNAMISIPLAKALLSSLFRTISESESSTCTKIFKVLTTNYQIFFPPKYHVSSQAH